MRNKATINTLIRAYWGERERNQHIKWAMIAPKMQTKKQLHIWEIQMSPNNMSECKRKERKNLHTSTLQLCDQMNVPIFRIFTIIFMFSMWKRSPKKYAKAIRWSLIDCDWRKIKNKTKIFSIITNLQPNIKVHLARRKRIFRNKQKEARARKLTKWHLMEASVYRWE